MKKSIMKKWVAALRSGDFKQGRRALESNGGNCCLGVLCNIALVEGVCDYYHDTKDGYFDQAHGLLPESVQMWAGMRTESGTLSDGTTDLVALNDTAGRDFGFIADFIEKNYKSL